MEAESTGPLQTHAIRTLPVLTPIDHGSPAYAQAVALRRTVLRLPLGLDFSPDELAAEHGDWHLAIWSDDGSILAGCLVLNVLGDGIAKMRQVAVAEEWRGRGLGRMLVAFAEQYARERGIRELVLNARATVVPFYEPLGYAVEGPPFVEVTLPHRRMRKILPV